MNDKKKFGNYLAFKRKQQNLTQEELANKLFVSVTTVSKWERGVTYPDISMITNLCRELHISEHEFFTACDDVRMNETMVQANKYQSITKFFHLFFLISYAIAIVTCFICNLAIDKTLSWFYIVLCSILIGFCITNLPVYLKKTRNKGILVCGIISILIYVLLAICCWYVAGNWLIGSFVIATFELGIIWIGILLLRFTSISIFFKWAIGFVLAAIMTIFTNPIGSRFIEYTSTADEIYNIITAGVFFMVSIILFFIGFTRTIKKDSKS